MTSGRRWGLVIGALVVVLAIDQWSKRWALERLSPDVVGGTGDIIEVLGPLQFNLAFNTGASFSMGSGSGGLIGLIAIVIVVVLVDRVPVSDTALVPDAVDTSACRDAHSV